MNARQSSTQTMGQNVSVALETITATHALPALVAASVALKTYLTNIKFYAALQAVPTTGHTEDRGRVFSGAITTTLMVAGPVRSYAKTNKLGDLGAKVAHTISDIRQTRISQRVLLLQQVHDAAASVLPHLADYGVTAEMLAEQQTQIDAASGCLTTPRARIMSRRVATERLGEVIQKMRNLLADEVDPLMVRLQATDPDGYAMYQAARLTINRPGSSGGDDETAPATGETATTLATTTPGKVAA